MKISTNPAQPTTDAAVKKATGKSWKEWFALLDKFGGPEKGRRDIGNHLAGELKVDPWWSSTIMVEYENARGVVEKDGRGKGYMICATKTIAAPTASAYAAWTDAKQWDKWLASKCKVAFTEGGTFSTADGHAGEIKKIRENKAIKFTWDDPACATGTVVEVTFQPKGDDKCVVMVAHDRIQTRGEADGLREAWGGALNTLKSLLEK